MTKNIFNIIIVAGLLSLAGCSENTDRTAACYSDKLSDKDKVLTRMSSGPQFNGGNDSLVDFLSDNISFDKLMSDLSGDGGVYRDTARIKFIVSKQGSLSDLSVAAAKTKVFAGEIARVIKKSSCNWVAGRTEQPVNGWFQFDIYFLVEKVNNEVKTTMTFNEYVPTD